MQPPPGSVTNWLAELRDPNPELREAASRRIWERYLNRLLELARDHLSTKLRKRVDPEDITQLAFHSFCDRAQRGEFRLDNRDDLWRLLVTITLNKARAAANFHQAQRRDIRREDFPSANASDPMESAFLEQIGGREPTPAEAIEFTDELANRLGQLTEELREVALAKLEGFTNWEIAEARGVAERTIERKLEKIRAIWQSP